MKKKKLIWIKHSNNDKRQIRIFNTNNDLLLARQPLVLAEQSCALLVQEKKIASSN